MLKLTIYIEPHTPAKAASPMGNALSFLNDPERLKATIAALREAFEGHVPPAPATELPESIYRQNKPSVVAEPAPLPATPPAAENAPEAPVASANEAAMLSANEAYAASANEAAMLRYSAMLYEGEQCFDVLIRTWTQNYGADAAPQPDRVGALMGAIHGHGPAFGAYVRERGGLAGACIDSIVRQSLVAVEAAVKLGQDVALNMVQVGSAVGVPLDTLLEKSMFRRELHDAPPAPGTLPAAEFDRSTLPLPR